MTIKKIPVFLNPTGWHVEPASILFVLAFCIGYRRVGSAIDDGDVVNGSNAEFNPDHRVVRHHIGCEMDDGAIVDDNRAIVGHDEGVDGDSGAIVADDDVEVILTFHFFDLPTLQRRALTW